MRLQERPEGIIVQFGGQTPLKIATQLETYLNENKIPTASGALSEEGFGTARCFPCTATGRPEPPEMRF